MARQPSSPTSRFKDESGASSGVQAGYQRSAASTEFDKGYIERNLKPYKKFGLNTNLADIAKMSDTQRYNQAADAVVAKYQAGLKPDKAPEKAPEPEKKKSGTSTRPRRRTGATVPRTRPQRKPEVSPKPVAKKGTGRGAKVPGGRSTTANAPTRKPRAPVPPQKPQTQKPAPTKKLTTKPPVGKRLPGGRYQD